MADHDVRLTIPVNPSLTVESLASVYEGLDNETVNRCEAARVSIAVDVTAHLMVVHDLLVPFGKFASWCRACGLDYASVTWAISWAKRQQGIEPERIRSRMHDFASDMTSLLSRLLRSRYFDQLSTDERVDNWVVDKFTSEPVTAAHARKLVKMLNEWLEQSTIVESE